MPRATRLAVLLLVAATGCAHAPGPGAGAENATPGSTDSAPAPGSAPGAAPSTPATPPPSAAPSTGPGPAASDDARARAERVAAIRAGVDAFLRTQGELLWDAWTRGVTPDFTHAVAAHPDLFTRDTVLLVRRARDGASGDERRALALLHAYLVGEYLGRAADGSGHAAPASLTWDGQSIPTSRVPSLLASEGTPARRAALGHAWAEAERSAVPSADARWGAITTAARALGYPSLAAAAADLRGEPVAALAKFAERVLATTDTTYRSLMDAVARAELGMAWADVRGRDVPRLLRWEERRAILPVSQTASSPRATFAGIGLDLPSVPGLSLDDQARPGKDPRALAVPIAVPGDVRVAFVTTDAASELRGVLRELGAATYYASVRRPEVEFRRLGPVTVGTWSDLFGGLVGEPAWLAERIGVDEPTRAALVRSNAARRLHRARMLAARVLDEIARERPAGRNGGASRKLLERALLRTVDDDEAQVFVAGRDPLLESADELRSLLLATDAAALLARRTGGPWWRSPEAGAWFTAQFAEGSRRPPAELARAFEADPADTAALIASTRARVEAAGLSLR